MDYLQENVDVYDKAFGKGYGLSYPDGHIIRSYEHVMKYELGMTGSKGEKLLDFGCGSGIHSMYFKSKGFDVYGVDTSSIAIEKCKEIMPDIADHFEVVDGKPDADNLFFGGDYDAILSNQVLYYMTDTDFELCKTSLYRRLKPGGIIIASMMGTENQRFQESEEFEDGLRKVKGKSRKKEIIPVTYVNFTSSREELIEKFSMFKPLQVGYYDDMIREGEGSSHHHLFIGQKKNDGM